MIQTLLCLTMAIYPEARGETFLGQIAVAQVILNRAEQRGMTVADVIYEPGQFSYLYDDVPDVPRDLSEAHDFVACMSAAITAMSLNAKGDNMGGANLYYSTVLPTPPYWIHADSVQYLVQIGKHRFYREARPSWKM